MSMANKVTKLRLGYHLNMIDICNAANQLHLLSDKKADRRNEAHLKKCFDCYERLGYKLPEECIEFKNS